jgi:hypothetical protein
MTFKTKKRKFIYGMILRYSSDLYVTIFTAKMCKYFHKIKLKYFKLLDLIFLHFK